MNLIDRCFLINEDGGYHNVIRWFLINEDGGYHNMIRCFFDK